MHLKNQLEIFLILFDPFNFKIRKYIKFCLTVTLSIYFMTCNTKNTPFREWTQHSNSDKQNFNATRGVENIILIVCDVYFINL